MLNKNVIVKVNREPFVILLENIFEKETIDKMLDEIIENKSNFEDGQIMDHAKQITNPKYRSNKTAYFDTIYKSDRTKSAILSNTQDLISSQFLIALLSSAQYPFSNYIFADIHETQVSRYGDDEQKYEWHIDRSNTNSERLLTISMYLFREPKKFTGGDVIFSNGLLTQDKLYGETNALRLVPKNNSCTIFSARTPHCVMPTKSPTEFKDGRFSIQIWLGKAGISDEIFIAIAKAIRSGIS